MRKCMVGLLAVIVSTSVAAAVSPKAGAYLGYTMGGDVENSAIAFGAQGGVEFNEYFSLVASVGRSTDDHGDTITPSDITALVDDINDAATALGLSTLSAPSLPSDFRIVVDNEPSLIDVKVTAVGTFPINDQFRVYGGGGVGYYILNWEPSVDIYPGGGAPRVTIDPDYDAENSVGFHAVLGASFSPIPNLELFAEYVYTMLKLKAEMKGATLSAEGTPDTEELDGDDVQDIEDGLADLKDNLTAAGFGSDITGRIPTSLDLDEDYNQGMLRIGALFRF